MRTTEAIHILVSVLTITLAFTFLWCGVSIDDPGHFKPEFFFIVLVTLGLGFILHELAHKYVAIHYGARAEYRAWTVGLFFALVMALTVGFVFAAPGAVYIFGRVTHKQNGKISLAGPLTNVVLALLFFALYPLLGVVSVIGTQVNLFLGFFNLIPFGPLDGSKIFAWNKLVWALVFTAALALLFLTPLFLPEVVVC